MNIMDLATGLDTAWVLLGAALVFFMQAGFAMVETGFTRAKNAGNIIMKNLMDFSLGTPIFLDFRFWNYVWRKCLWRLAVGSVIFPGSKRFAR